MKLLSLTLLNYIGIYNGLGQTKIMIPFKNCKNKIVLIKGDNGSGKSTIFRALTPFADSSDEFIPNVEAYKNIKYLLDDGSILDISYTHKVQNKSNEVITRLPTRCSVLRFFQGQEPIELNPSGNVTSGKEVIYHLFQLDDNFIVLSALSAVNKGIGSYRPAERKRYVNSIISALDGFIALNNTFSKKAVVVKSLLNNLSNKLTQIGNANVLQDSIKSYQIKIEELESKRTALISASSSYQTQLDDINKNGSIIDIYAKNNQSLIDTRKSIREFKFTYPETKYSEKDFISIQSSLSKEDASIEIFSAQMEDLLKKESSLRYEITKKEHEVEDESNLVTIQDIDCKLKNLNEQIEYYQNLFSGANILKSITMDKEEFKAIIEKLNMALAMIQDLYDQFYIDDIRTVLLSPDNHYSTYSSFTYKQEREKIQNTKDFLISRIAKSNSSEELANEIANIPKECNLSEKCAYYKRVKDAVSNVLNVKEIEEIEKQIEYLTNSLKSLDESNDKSLIWRECQNDCKNLIAFLKDCNFSFIRLTGKPYFKSDESIKQFILAHTTFQKIDLSLISSYYSYLDIIKGLQEDKNSLEKMKKEKSEEGRVLGLSIQLESYKMQLETLLQEKTKLSEKLTTKQNNKTTLETQLQQMNIARHEQEKYDVLLHTLKELEALGNQIHDKATLATELLEKVVITKRELSKIESNELPELTRVIEQAKYQLTMYQQYKRDYNSYSDIYNKLLSLKEHSSIHGIQSVYIEAFMNSTLQLTNQLLQHLFQGRFMIKEFIVNDKEFSIPCVDNEGKERRDISEMSDSQLSMISMIISFILLYKSTGFYKVIKLDEVDANLDNMNRLQFSILINHVLELLHFDQCVIISHNNEIDMNQADLVVLRMNETEYANLKSNNINIIYDWSQK